MIDPRMTSTAAPGVAAPGVASGDPRATGAVAPNPAVPGAPPMDPRMGGYGSTTGGDSRFAEGAFNSTIPGYQAPDQQGSIFGNGQSALMGRQMQGGMGGYGQQMYGYGGMQGGAPGMQYGGMWGNPYWGNGGFGFGVTPWQQQGMPQMGGYGGMGQSAYGGAQPGMANNMQGQGGGFGFGGAAPEGFDFMSPGGVTQSAAAPAAAAPQQQQQQTYMDLDGQPHLSNQQMREANQLLRADGMPYQGMSNYSYT